MVLYARTGYVFAIRSERQICREVQVNLAYRWFCDLGLEDIIPDHSAFSSARNERFRESGIFGGVFERVVTSCIEAGLVGGESFAVDAKAVPIASAAEARGLLAPSSNRAIVRSVVFAAAARSPRLQLRSPRAARN